MSIDPVFSSTRLSLVDRGFLYAIAHVRGGGELGRHWYDDGKMLNKPNTFTDFVACARTWWIRRWASPDLPGGQRGVGRRADSRRRREPGATDCSGRSMAEVPFVDCLTTMLDPTLPLTVTEWEEWGNPVEDADDLPGDEVVLPLRQRGKAGVRYPDILATAGLSDPRVGFLGAGQMGAEAPCGESRTAILLKTEMGAGHGGPSGRYDAWKEEALSIACMLDSLGLSTK